MRRIGLVGSMEGDLPASYCRIINKEVRLRCGEHHTANCTVHAIDADELGAMLRLDDWTSLAEALVAAAVGLRATGIEALALCGSPLNPLARQIGRSAGLPTISMTHAIRATLKMFRYRRVLLIGAKTEREEHMWTDALQGVDIGEMSSAEIDWFETLATASEADDEDQLRAETRRVLVSIRRRGVQAFVLAEPALQRWLNLDEAQLPVFDAAEIHAWAASGWALKGMGQMLSAPPCVMRDDLDGQAARDG